MATLKLKMGDPETGKFAFYKAVQADIEGGLAVHKELGKEDFWQISHEPTGMFIIGGLSYANAIAARSQLLPLTDWTTVKFQAQADADRRALMKSVAEVLWVYRIDFEFYAQTILKEAVHAVS